MKKNKLFRAFASLAFPLCTIVPTCAVSCNKKVTIESMELQAETTAVYSNTKTQVNAILKPTNQINNDMTWSLVDENDNPIYWAFITRKGVINVPLNVSKAPIIFYVKAVYPLDQSISAKQEFVFYPGGYTNKVKGFNSFDHKGQEPNNAISYTDREGKTTTMQLLPDETGRKWRNEKPIDVYMEQESPSEWEGAIFYFEPVFDDSSGEVSHSMCLWHKWTELLPPSEMSASYISIVCIVDDGEWFQKLPQMIVNRSNLTEETLRFKFACEGDDFELLLTFNCWQKITQDTNVVFSYDKQPGDPHTIVYNDQGDYTTQLFCPSEKSRTIYRESMSSIYVYRNFYEQLDVRFEFNTDNMDERIKKSGMFSLKYDATLYTKPFDHQKYYILSIYYNCDLNKIDWDPADDGYEDLVLGTLYVYDNVIEGIEAKLEMYLRWV